MTRQTIVDAIATLIPEYVTAVLAPFGERLSAVENREPIMGPAGVAGAAGKDGEPGRDGADGRDGRDAELPAVLVERLQAFDRERAEQISTEEVLATFTALLRKEWAPILAPPQAVTIEKRVIRDSSGRITGSIETRS